MKIRPRREIDEGAGQLAFDLIARPPADTTSRFLEYLRSQPSPNEVAQELVLGYLGPFNARVSVISTIEPDATVRMIGGFGQPGPLLEGLGTGSLWDGLPPAKAIRNQKSLTFRACDLLPPLLGLEGDQQVFVAVPLMTTVSMVGSVCVGFADQAESVSLAAATLEALADIYVLYLMANMPHDTKLLTPSDAGAPKTRSSSEPVSARQLAILDLLAQGMTYNQIAVRIGYSHSTVRMEVMQVYRIFGVSNRRAAVKVGIARGLVQSALSDAAASSL